MFLICGDGVERDSLEERLLSPERREFLLHSQLRLSASLNEKTILYINKVKLAPSAADALKTAGVVVEDYGNVVEGLRHFDGYNILLDPNQVNYALFSAVSAKKVVEAASPVPYLKCVKNEAEIRGFHSAMLRDGVAMLIL